MLPITIDELTDHYPVLLFDAYGVLVHSGGAMPGAARLIRRLEDDGHAYMVLTNDASKLPDTAAARFRSFGLPLGAGRIVTSGQLLAPFFARRGLVGCDCAVLGPPDSRVYVEQAGGRVVDVGSDFQVLVVADEAGYPLLETLDSVISTLFRLFDRGEQVALVLPNPDLVYPKGDQGYGLTAGSLALVVEAALQRRYPHQARVFHRLGKPCPDLFVEALGRAGPGEAVMIGDQLETDIGGARAAGVASALVATGVSLSHPPAIPQGLEPDYLLSSLESSQQPRS